MGGLSNGPIPDPHSSPNWLEVDENVTRAHFRIDCLVVKWCNKQSHSFHPSPNRVNVGRAKYVWSSSGPITIVVKTLYSYREICLLCLCQFLMGVFMLSVWTNILHHSRCLYVFLISFHAISVVLFCHFTFLPLSKVIASRVVFVIVSRSDGRMETLWSQLNNSETLTDGPCINGELIEIQGRATEWAHSDPHVPKTEGL